MDIRTDSGVYEIVNRVTGDRYIGSTTRNFHTRWAGHRSALAHGRGSRHLNGAWRKYGPENFHFRVLMCCPPEDALYYEQLAIDSFCPAYNLSPTAGNTQGVTLTAERKAKIAASHRGRRHPHAKRFVVDGAEASYVEHAERIGVVSPELVKNRLKSGWDIEKALRTPTQIQGMHMKDPQAAERVAVHTRGRKASISPEALASRNAKIAEANRRRTLGPDARKNMSDAQRARGTATRYRVNGELLSAMDVAERYPISRHTFLKRIQAGWDPDRAAATPVRNHKRGN